MMLTLTLAVLANNIHEQVPATRCFVAAHAFYGQELQMPMRLTGTTMLSGIEESKQTLLIAGRSLLPCFQAGKRRLQIILFQYMRLLFVRLGCENEMFGNNRELVKD